MTEWVGGGSLRDHLTGPDAAPSVPDRRKWTWLLEVARALEFAADALGLSHGNLHVCLYVFFEFCLHTSHLHSKSDGFIR